jgi:hypothetical protein
VFRVWGRKVKLSLVINYALRQDDEWRSGGTAPRFLNVGTRWRWVSSLTPWPLYRSQFSARFLKKQLNYCISFVFSKTTMSCLCDCYAVSAAHCLLRQLRNWSVYWPPDTKDVASALFACTIMLKSWPDSACDRHTGEPIQQVWPTRPASGASF